MAKLSEAKRGLEPSSFDGDGVRSSRSWGLLRRRSSDFLGWLELLLNSFPLLMGT